MEVRAFVASAPARPLRWRLVIESRSAGGVSNVSQGGSTQGDRTDPVGAVTVTAGSEGSATLIVYDGEREVARDTAPLDGDAADAS
jgi:hypothetical protein